MAEFWPVFVQNDYFFAKNDRILSANSRFWNIILKSCKHIQSASSLLSLDQQSDMTPTR